MLIPMVLGIIFTIISFNSGYEFVGRIMFGMTIGGASFSFITFFVGISYLVYVGFAVARILEKLTPSALSDSNRQHVA